MGGGRVCYTNVFVCLSLGGDMGQQVERPIGARGRDAPTHKYRYGTAMHILYGREVNFVLVTH